MPAFLGSCAGAILATYIFIRIFSKILKKFCDNPSRIFWSALIATAVLIALKYFEEGEMTDSTILYPLGTIFWMIHDYREFKQQNLKRETQ